MEGSIWEAVLTISSLKLNNITLIIDNNDLQSATRQATHTSHFIQSKKNLKLLNGNQLGNSIIIIKYLTLLIKK